MHRARPLLLLTSLVLAPVGCADRAPVQVRAFFQRGVPLPGLELTAIPFDPDAVLDSLARLAEYPRPSFPALRQRIEQYRKQDEPVASTVETSANVAWLATKDSVTRMARELSRGDRKSAAYREAYGRFRQLYGRYTTREAERESRLRSSMSGDREFAREVTHASDSLRAWESAAYREFPAVARERVQQIGRPPQQAETDSLGTAELELPNGDWWIQARLPDPDNPFQELHWNLPVRIAGGFGLGLPLMRSNARVEWKH